MDRLKSFLVDTVKHLMPEEEVVSVTSLSDQALNYIEDLTHKFLVLGEAVHGEVVEHQIREMLSGKELSRLVTIKDPETGKMRSQVVRKSVIVSSVMSGTNYAINPEKIERELGWRAQYTLADGLKATVAWYLANMDWVQRVQNGSYRQWIETNYAGR